jgi:hypothetical protein
MAVLPLREKRGRRLWCFGASVLLWLKFPLLVIAESAIVREYFPGRLGKGANKRSLLWDEIERWMSSQESWTRIAGEQRR